tara:strand:+ start:25460 stop:29788 length:4329 start_codon:yes stop_codon:yes gene_type:complete
MDSKLAVREHIKRKCKLYFDDPDTVSGHIENERAVTNDYRGRVLYELLQNAVDRAETHIWITLDKEKRSLVVANDGKPFSAVARQGEPRSDLVALCNLHVSNKKTGESIGNKGVGFKSVWEFCNSVQIRTRNGPDETWGVRLRWPFYAKALEGWDDQYSAADISSALGASSIEKKHQGRAPSFYFPEYISAPVWQEDGAVTAVELEDIPEEDFERLLSGPLAELMGSTLAFIGDIRTDDAKLQLTVRVEDEVSNTRALYTVDDDWLRIDIDTAACSDKLKEYRDKLGFELTRNPRLSLAFPLQPTADEVAEGSIHSYLPTEVKTGSPLHIQGDFYLSESRKNIDFTNNQYNHYLLEIAVDVLLESLTVNRDGVAELPYSLKLLQSTGTISALLKERLLGSGEVLSAIFTSVISSGGKRTLSFYDDIYSLIGRYTPPKTRFLYRDHKNETLAPYFRCFSNVELDLVPLEFEPKSDEAPDPVVTHACPLSFPDAGGDESKLFCRRSGGISQGLNTIDVPGVVVTNWRFPVANDLSRNLKDLAVWSDYEAIPVLRSLVRAQNEADLEEEKASLLRAALETNTPKEIYTQTQWRFLSDEVHPSQRLLIPACTDAGWEEARYCFIDDRHPDLADYLAEGVMFQVDVERCLELLGSEYSSILRYWGVWDVIPLISIKGSRSWELPLASYPVGLRALDLLSDSYQVWEESQSQASLTAVLSNIRDEAWLSVSAGSTSAVSPSSAYLGIPNGDIDGFHLINPDVLNDAEWHFLLRVGVTAVESTHSVDKLVSTLETIASGCIHHRQIKGPLLSAYRQLLKRVNRICLDSEEELSNELLNRIPLFYESEGRGARGLASREEQVWYVSGSHRSTRTKMGGSEALWWLASGDIGTLANMLEGVNTLTTDTKMVGLGEECANSGLRDLLECEYLPSFMALACYGDIPGLTDIDEALVQRRWQSLEVASITEAVLHESVGSTGNPVKETITKIVDAVLLWEPLRADQKKKLQLYVSSDYSTEQEHFKRRVCLWFAEEVFRRRELARHFEQILIKGVTLQEFNVSPVALNDAIEIIREWLPDVMLDQMLSVLSSVTGCDVNKRNWRDSSIYARSGLRFDQLQDSLPSELNYYLAPLNPIEKNEARLLSFVDLNIRNLSAVKAFCDLQHEDWLALLADDNRKFDFDFDPELFVLDHVRLDKKSFSSLGDSIDLELKQVESENSSVVFPSDTTFSPDSSGTAWAGGRQALGWKGGLVSAKTDEEHASQQLSNAKVGKSLEKYLAIKAAKRIAQLSVGKQEALCGLIRLEYTRLGAYTHQSSKALPDLNLLEASPPYSERKWLEIIHVGHVADGAGYDYIDFDTENDQVLLVEAKSTRRDSPVIHISEPERRHIIKYASHCFLSENPSSSWRMLLVKGELCVDVTGVVSDVVLSHNADFSLINSCMKASDWIVEGVSVE